MWGIPPPGRGIMGNNVNVNVNVTVNVNVNVNNAYSLKCRLLSMKNIRKTKSKMNVYLFFGST